MSTFEIRQPMTRPWAELDESYREDIADIESLPPSLTAMAALVTAIRSSRYSEGLFAWRSMWTLCIAQTEAYYPDKGPFLRIAPVGDHEIEPRYFDTGIRSDQWNRRVPATAAFARLEHFLVRDLHWFPPETPE